MSSMTSSHRFLTALFSICVLTLIASPSLGMISVGVLTKKRAKEKYGITMHARKNGDAGIKVWLQRLGPETRAACPRDDASAASAAALRRRPRALLEYQP